MTTPTHDHHTARAVLDAQRQRADHRQVGELVRYPRLHGDGHITAVGTVLHIACITPNLPYNQRILEFTLRADDGRTDRLRVSNGYRGIVTVQADGG